METPGWEHWDGNTGMGTLGMGKCDGNMEWEHQDGKLPGVLRREFGKYLLHPAEWGIRCHPFSCTAPSRTPLRPFGDKVSAGQKNTESRDFQDFTPGMECGLLTLL